MNLKKLFTSWRIILLIVVLVLSIIAIRPSFNEDGVAIRTVARNSSAANAGMVSPTPNTPPMQREVILSVNNQPVTDTASFNDLITNLTVGDQVIIKTNKDTYILTVKEGFSYTTLNETETVEVVDQEFDNETNSTVNVTKYVEKPVVIKESLGPQDIGLTVYDRPTSNIRKGLDLEGGTRVLLEPEEEVSDETLDLIISNIKQRINVYGVSDVIVRPAKDFSGKTFISVEIAGVNKDEVRELLAKQGKFEAKVGSTTVFLGGDEIAYVCRTADCSGIDPNYGCGEDGNGGYVCRFRFAITLTQEAADKQAAATKDLDVILDGNGQGYLSENLSLYLDDQLVDQLRISEGLKGNAITDISISGSGEGRTEQEAAKDAMDNMKQLQTVLITGSLPVKLDIVKTDAISPILGAAFLKNVIFIGFLAMIAVILVVIIRYRQWRISIPMIVAMGSEVIILLGVASLIGWRLDLAAIAGIIIAVGTGVDDQIVIADETLHKKRSKVQLSWQDRLKRAFFIIMASYFTTFVAMLPLWFSGAGLLKGFAFTTIIGVTIGVFITRPAFAAIVEQIIEN